MAESGAKTGLTSPPAGTGQVPGLGEAFRINLNTGQGVYTYKIPLPAGVARHTPNLSLEYAHGAGTGAFGFGWRLAERRIGRRLDYGLKNGAPSESFMDSGAEIVRSADGTYRAGRETAFTAYHRAGDGWRAEERSGLINEFGLTPGGRLADPDHPDRVTEWLLERSIDACGNAIAHVHDIQEGIGYLREIRYAAYSVRFSYEKQPEARFNGRAGYARRLALRCARIELFLDPGPGERRIRSWTLNFGLEPVSNVSILESIQIVSHGVPANGSGDVPRAPVRFTYSTFDPNRYSVQWMDAEGSQPPALSEQDTALVTLDDAPLPGILQVVNGRQYYWRNRGDATWSRPAPVTRTPRLTSFGRAGVAFMDVDSSGTADMVQAGDEDSLPGYYENGGRRGWSRFVAYRRGSRSMPEWNSGRIRLTDADGDGRVDAMMSTRRAFALWFNNGEDGWSQPVLAPKGSGDSAPDIDLGDPSVHMADMTGDGMQDLVRVRSGLIEYWPSLGFGRYGARVRMRNCPRLRDLPRHPDNVLLMDVNGDGCADLVFVSAAGIKVYHNRNGVSFSDGAVFDVTPPAIPGTIRPADMSGRGRTGLVYNSRQSRGTGYVSVSFGSDEPPLLLTQVDSGTGLVSEIRYRPAVQDYLDDLAKGELWDTNFPFPLLVVGSTSETDLVSGHKVETEYRYHHAHYETRTRQFQGFRRAERIEKGDASRADTVTVFHFLMAQERLPGNGPEHAHLNGMMRRTEVYGRDGSVQEGRPFTVEEADYVVNVLEETPDGSQRVFLFVTARRNEDTERTNDLRGEERTYEYDGFGNVVRERLRGYGVRAGTVQPEKIRVTQTEYAKTAGGELTGKPCRITIRDDADGILTEIRRYYDGGDFVGLAFGRMQRGLVTRESHLVLPEADFQERYAEMDDSALGYYSDPDADGNPAVFIDAELHAYDARGLRLADRGPLGHERRYEYEASGLFRTKLIDGLGETRFEYDRASGEPLRIVYADGAETRLTYDAQGRVLSVQMPGDLGGQPARAMVYDDLNLPNSRTTTFRHAAGAGGRSHAAMYYDGRGKEFQERIETSGGQFVVSNLALRNPWGDVKEEFEPVFDGSLAFSRSPLAGKPSRKFFFDPRGRVIRTINYNGGISTAQYLPFEIVTADANDNDASAANLARGQFNTPRREEFDVLRDRTRTVEASGSAIELTTTFRTGSLGELLAVSDNRGILCTYEYDRLGNRLQLDHREAGQRRIWFDARRKAVRTMDARGNDIRAEIDFRGRLERLSVGGVAVEQYVYDDTARNALGRLSEVTYRGGRQSFHYDAAGRLERNEHFFDGHAAAHTVTYEYDGLGRQTVRTHTDGTRIERELTPNGWVRAIPGFLDEVGYDARGLPVRLRYANGVTTEYSYTEGAGRLKTRRTSAPGGQTFEDVTYSYDLLQMLLSSNDAAPGGGQRTFAYDALYQVTASTADEAGSPRTRSYTYSAPFNLNGFEEADTQMKYDDPLHPDRVAGIIQGGGARFDVLYDADGNVTELPGQRFQYDFKDMMERFEGAGGLTADYRYDHTATRISKRVDDGQGITVETLFVSDLAEIRDGQPAYFVHLGHLRVAIVRPGSTRFVHCDEMGGTAFFSDAAATKITSIAYRPFGNLASASGPTDFRTYGVHPFDEESGLYYMKRRYYSPALGRFLSTDPLAVYQPSQYLSNPKALHPYIFSGNDPLNKVDLDGYSFWSVVGAIVGVIVAITVAALVIMTGGALGIVLGLALAIGLVAVGYVVADATAGTDFGEFMRGFLIGLNAGFNAILASAVFGPMIGVALGVINFLAAFDTIANSEIYQGILGWASWLMPMSWLATAVGLIVFVLNIIPAIFTLNMVDAVKIENISIDWGTGTIVMEGGWLFLPGFRGGYNLGNFAYITPGSTVTDHETGHTLSNAAFGSIFHFIGAIDENAVSADPADAFAERIAESHDPSTTDPDILPMWV